MEEIRFEPFMDRLSRDIRNDLSESLVEVLRQRHLRPAREVAQGYLSRNLASCYGDYIINRLSQYQSSLKQIAAGNDDPLWQGLVLWDHGLFFEVHEILEHAWLGAGGEEKLLLQAMIRAAGVYIKLEHGYDAAARKIADKALPVLAQNRERLAAYIDPERLLEALGRLAQPAPKLLPPA
ncbi:DUF309 domain-containing protein [Desulfogranum mediterraneum]|uniref:DUF309 domain-containing protein n=1 Tax=Desulfogranum mediterraneum TaxID=160661 RepID=UPI00040AA1FA|nr:DUF309 domain-containing protein [Desulfogranum mediterraneum]